MIGAKLTLPNGKRFTVVARSGSYSICWQSLPANLQTVPANKPRWHPISASPYGGANDPDEPAVGMCCMVRDPVERFRSSCARQQCGVQEGLERSSWDVHFWPLSQMGLLVEGVTHFKFPSQLNDCASYLGLPTPVPTLNAEADENKPTLTAEQEAAVRERYADDIALWDLLNQ